VLITKDVFEIVIYGRGGQGAKIAGQLIAETAIIKGKHAQAFPDYGPERSGALIRSFARISDKPIKTYQPITEPDLILVIDPTLLSLIDLDSRNGEGVMMIVNSEETGEKIKKITGFKGEIRTVDATGISIKHMGRNLPNMPMLGAFVRLTKMIELESLMRKVRDTFEKKIGKEKTESNITAIREAYEGMKHER
jgi:pyruvate ferredoxin oxidoreductase gamma subunit